MSEKRPWDQVVLDTLKQNEVRLVPYVPDKVLGSLITKLHADPSFTTFPTAREEEAVGIVVGGWMGGVRGAILMQTSGFARSPTRWPRSPCPIRSRSSCSSPSAARSANSTSARRWCAAPCARCWNSLAMEHHTITDIDALEFIVDRSIKQAVATQAAVTFILSPLLTGGKVFAA